MPKHGPRYSEEEARAAVAAARSHFDAMVRLGVRPAGGNHATLKKYLALWGISTDNFDWGGARPPRREAIPLDEVLVEGSNYERKRLKRRLVEAGLKELRCEMCGQGEMWRGVRMGLVLDHVNGVWNDNRLENLRFLCPNCNATLDTHCGRKNRREVLDRECGYCGESFTPMNVISEDPSIAEVRQAALLLAALWRAPQRACAASRRAPAVRPAAGRARRDELLSRRTQVRRVGQRHPQVGTRV